MNSIPESSRFRLLDLVIDLERQTVIRDDKAIELPDLSFRLLAALAKSAPAALEKDELISAVWGNVVVSDETLSQRVRLLRQALEEDAQEPRYIAAVRGRGYRLLCPVEPITATETVGRSPRLPVLLAMVGLVGLIVLTAWFLWPEKAPRSHAIAVLPFADLSPEQDYGYFADGMQEELLSRLARLPSLSVASRTSVERYRGGTQSLPDIAHDLGVDVVVESSVRVADDRVRITVQLIDATTDSHLWAETYDRELSVANIFAIQQEVAENVAEALALEFEDHETESRQLLPTENVAAYDRYLLGRYHTFRQTPEDLAVAIDNLLQAIEMDPEFAEAWSTLGWAYSFQGTPYGGKPPHEVYPLAKNAVTRSLALDNNLSDAHTLYADILAWYDWDFELAEREYRKTLELDPTNVLGYVLMLSAQMRHDEALELIERRIAAAPDDPYVRINAGWAYLRARQFDRAIQAAEMAPGHTDSSAIIGFSLLGQGKPGEALAVFESDSGSRESSPRQTARVAIASFKAGDVQRGEALLRELKASAQDDFLSPGLIADVYFAAGDADQAFEWVNKAIGMRSRSAIFLRCNQMLDGFRSDPRYQEALLKVGI